MRSTPLSSTYERGASRFEFASREPILVVSIGDLQQPNDLLVRYRDRTARLVEAQQTGTATGLTQFVLPALNNTALIDLEFILQQPIVVEFFVKPQKANLSTQAQQGTAHAKAP